MTSSSQINKIYIGHLFSWEVTGGDKSRNNEWDPPPLYTKVNFDASVREEKTCVATVGRYRKKEVILVTSVLNINNPALESFFPTLLGY